MDTKRTDRSGSVFDNPQPDAVYRKALRSRASCTRHCGSDESISYPARLAPAPELDAALGLRELLIGAGLEPGVEEFDRERGLILGVAPDGFGTARSALAMASCARALGFKPYWMDLDSYTATVAGKAVAARRARETRLDRLAKRCCPCVQRAAAAAQERSLRKLSTNAVDQKCTELMAPLFRNVPKDIPVLATHAWLAQAAVHAGMRHVLNAVPDNLPLAARLAEGSLHTVQTHHAYQGYRVLFGMDGKRVLHPMPEHMLACAGHYVSDVLVSNLATDCAARTARKTGGAPLRFLLHLDGSGAQQEMLAAVLRHLRPAIMRNHAAVLLDLGAHGGAWQQFTAAVPGLEGVAKLHFEDLDTRCAFAASLLRDGLEGVHVFRDTRRASAAWCTEQLLRAADVLVTAPDDLAFAPIPKLFLPGRNALERWNAVHSAELGDGTMECADLPHVTQMLDLFLYEDTMLMDFLENIIKNQIGGVYDGAYWAVRLAMGMKRSATQGA